MSSEASDWGRRGPAFGRRTYGARPAAACFVAHKTKLCHRYEKGICTSSHCTFAHGPSDLKVKPDLRKTKLCDTYTKTGSCIKGNDCAFAHGYSELQATSEYFKTSLCPNWQQGRCDFGDLCRHAHGKADLRPRPIPRLPPDSENAGARRPHADTQDSRWSQKSHQNYDSSSRVRRGDQSRANNPSYSRDGLRAYCKPAQKLRQEEKCTWHGRQRVGESKADPCRVEAVNRGGEGDGAGLVKYIEVNGGGELQDLLPRTAYPLAAMVGRQTTPSSDKVQPAEADTSDGTERHALADSAVPDLKTSNGSRMSQCSALADDTLDAALSAHAGRHSHTDESEDAGGYHLEDDDPSSTVATMHSYLQSSSVVLMPLAPHVARPAGDSSQVPPVDFKASGNEACEVQEKEPVVVNETRPDARSDHGLDTTRCIDPFAGLGETKFSPGFISTPLFMFPPPFYGPPPISPHMLQEYIPYPFRRSDTGDSQQTRLIRP